MPRPGQPKSGPRAARAILGGSILALILLQNGRQVHARVHQLSITGGLLHLSKPIDEGVGVEVAFHLGESTVRAQAQMLFPMWATQGWLQPFRFIDLDGDHRRTLERDLQLLTGATGTGPSSQS